MLPLAGQKLALINKDLGTSLIAACIVAAQGVMVPVAMGAKADSWGRKPIFLAGFAMLALRGFLYPLSDNPYWLVGVQLLDGFGAGIFGALFPVIVGDIVGGNGRFNVSAGAIATAQGIGRSSIGRDRRLYRCEPRLQRRLLDASGHRRRGLHRALAGDARDIAG